MVFWELNGKVFIRHKSGDGNPLCNAVVKGKVIELSLGIESLFGEDPKKKTEKNLDPIPVKPKSLADVNKSVEYLKQQGIINNDLNKIGSDILSTYTFKTQWLLVRPKLLKTSEYDDDICRTHIFRHGRGMNNLRLKKKDPQELKAVMETEAGKTESLYIWKQIQLIVCGV